MVLQRNASITKLGSFFTIWEEVLQSRKTFITKWGNYYKLVHRRQMREIGKADLPGKRQFSPRNFWEVEMAESKTASRINIQRYCKQNCHHYKKFRSFHLFFCAKQMVEPMRSLVTYLQGNFELVNYFSQHIPWLLQKQPFIYLFIYLFIFNLFNVDKLTYIFDIWR